MTTTTADKYQANHYGALRAQGLHAAARAVLADRIAVLAASVAASAPPADDPGHLDYIEQATERITRHLDAQGYRFDVADVQDAINAATA